MPYCPTCKTEKDLSEFYKTKARKSGIHGQCKDCEKAYNASKKTERAAYMRKHRNNEEVRKREAANTSKRTRLHKNEFFSVPVETLRNSISYNGETGEFINKDTDKIICPIRHTKGYDIIPIHKYKVKCSASRLAMFLTYGEWFDCVDHINGNRSDNRICNLRACSTRENDCNRERHRNGELIGAWHRPDNDTWIARIRINGKLTRIGPYYKTKREASLHYCRYVLKHKLVRREFLPETFTDEELYMEEADA